MIPTELLRYYPYFAGVSNESLKAVAAIGEEETVGAGKTVFKEGDPARSLYLVVSGQVEITLELGNGRSVVVDTVVPGDLTGWSAFIEPYRLRATAIARRESKLIAIDAEKLRKLCDEDNALGYRLMRQIAGALSHRFNGALTQIAASG
ncbi:MAG: cyclic nucleotide-binding domain-containing protein [Candidatus Latescibacterota bacterium]|nr:MAG: cyclic nucleotide-binding domain-containing protein [Candidatus Latescibacterota bacterium]